MNARVFLIVASLLAVASAPVWSQCCDDYSHVFDFDQSDNGVYFELCAQNVQPCWRWGGIDHHDWTGNNCLYEVPYVACDGLAVGSLLTTQATDEHPSTQRSCGHRAILGPIALESWTTALELCHWCGTYVDPPHTDSRGGFVVEVSTDGGSTWNRLEPVGGYNEIAENYVVCLENDEVFGGCGPMGSFWRHCFDISPYAGTEIHLALLAGTDHIGYNMGWFVRSVKLGGTAGSPVEEGQWTTIKCLYR